jgi:hypothetical protein
MFGLTIIWLVPDAKFVDVMVFFKPRVKVAAVDVPLAEILAIPEVRLVAAFRVAEPLRAVVGAVLTLNWVLLRTDVTTVPVASTPVPAVVVTVSRAPETRPVVSVTVTVKPDEDALLRVTPLESLYEAIDTCVVLAATTGVVHVNPLV